MRYFMTPADEEAMAWIQAETPPDALFAINTHLWLSDSPHGTDGGFWIPYFTNRKTTTGSMLNGLGPPEYFTRIQALSRQVKAYETQQLPARLLCDSGIHYVYLGQKRGNFIGPGLLPENIIGAKTVYQRDGVQILSVCEP
jgi:hypothetical protein